jgi:hypothetical protein
MKRRLFIHSAFFSAAFCGRGECADSERGRFTCELGPFFNTELPETVTLAQVGEARIQAEQKLPDVALPGIAMLLGTEQEDFLKLCWWQKTNRDTRAAIVAIFLCSRSASKDDALEVGIPSFEAFSKRFEDQERIDRLEEIEYVKANLSGLAGRLSKMTDKIARLEPLHRLYKAVAK